MKTSQMHKFKLSLLLLLALTLAACAPKKIDLPENATYVVFEHADPNIKPSTDMLSFAINGLALNYSLRTVGTGEQQSLRLDIVDLRFGKPGVHTPYRIMCSSARLTERFGSMAMPPVYYESKSELDGCFDEVMLDGKLKGVSIQFHGTNQNDDKTLINWFFVTTPIIVPNPLPRFSVNAKGEHVLNDEPPTGKQFSVGFQRPGYEWSGGGYH